MKDEFGSTGEMTPTWESGSSLRKTCLNAALSTINPTRTGPRDQTQASAMTGQQIANDQYF